MSPLAAACIILLSNPPATQPLADRAATRPDQLTHLLKMINDYRTEKKLAPVKPQKRLTEAAVWMANDLAVKDYFSHTDSQGRGPAVRADSFGYKDWITVCENIAAGVDDAKNAFEMWVRSPGHRKNMENPDVREIGLGYAFSASSKYQKYWVQLMGARADYAKDE